MGSEREFVKLHDEVRCHDRMLAAEAEVERLRALVEAEEQVVMRFARETGDAEATAEQLRALLRRTRAIAAAWNGNHRPPVHEIVELIDRQLGEPSDG